MMGLFAVKLVDDVHVYKGRFYVRSVGILMKTAKVHTSCIYLERLSFYLYMQPKTILKCGLIC